MYVQLAPGESLLPGTRDALTPFLADPRVEAVLVPLVPQGDHALARAARRYLAAWDARLVHSQNFFAPAARVASRHAPAGPRNAHAAPMLADALAGGKRIEALRVPAAGVATHIGDDLGAWSAHFRAEGRAWSELALRDPRFGGFAPPAWARHNLVQIGRRVIEILEARRGVDPLVVGLHLARVSAFSDVAPLSIRSSPRPPG